MANINILTSNYRNVSHVINSYDKQEKSRDDLLKTYGKSIKQVPDHYQNNDGKATQIKPTTIAGAARNLIKAVKTEDPVLLKIDPKKYMKVLHQSHKYGNWTLFDYKNSMPVDSAPEKVRKILGKYQDGIHHDINLARIHEKEEADEMELGD